MEQLTTLELALLQLVRTGAGQWGWYQLGIRLSCLDVPRQPSMMTVLKNLQARGLVLRHVTPGSPHDRWELTEEGLAVLQANESAQA